MKYIILQDSSTEDDEDARDAVRTALSALPVGASDRAVEQAKQAALAPILERIDTRVQQHRAEQEERAMMARLESRLGWKLSAEDKETAMGKARAAMDALPGALVEQRERAGQKVVDRYVAKEKLIEDGLREIYPHAQRMLKEYDYAGGETALGIEWRTKDAVEKTLHEELTGRETPDDAVDRVHEIMEELEGCD